MSSFEKINYNLRPNKCIERKMMCDALGRLSFLQHLNNFRYIGFGSPYFADFILFHRSLGIHDLISIEKEEAKKNRFEFNIPYSSIQMKYGHSSTILPNLELHLKNNILWLDYDDKVSDYMFSDIDSFFANTKLGSFFIISVNVEEDFLSNDKLEGSLKEFRINQLYERVGKSRVPLEFMTLNMNTKNLINVTYEMINRQIKTSLFNRNGDNPTEIIYDQIFNFVYKDNATILTLGGIVYEKSQKLQVEQMAFENFEFVKSGAEPYKIKSPNLTLREIKALDKILPSSTEIEKGHFVNTKLANIPLIPTDIQNYAKIYRYYPHFTETNI